MSDDKFALSTVLAAKARALGPAGAAWVAELPDLVASLEQRWSVTVGDQLSGGTSAYVAEARTAAGEPAVLKISLPDGAMAREIRTLEAAQGRGYVRTIRSDAAVRAVLMERLGASLSSSGLPPETQLETICGLLPLAWQVPRLRSTRPTVESDDLHDSQPRGDQPHHVGARADDPSDDEPLDKARQLAELTTDLWQRVRPPCSEAVLELALHYAGRRSAAFDPDSCVVVHGDAAAGNVLAVLDPRAGAVNGYVLVDPDGFVGDAAYDLGVALRDWCPELLAGDPVTVARRYCSVLARGSGVDERAIWEWGFMERVSTGLYVWSLGAEDVARPFLVAAEALSADP